MDLETAQRIERLEYLVEVLCRHQGLDADRLLGPHASPPPFTGDWSPVNDAVPAGYAPAPAPAAGFAEDPRLPPAFYDCIRAGKKIQAIKIYREVTGLGLKESKDYVDRISR